ncbi:MAG TPA: universal stress protein [Planctomycetota bacterium]|nr:universal stress protein [Planctomycetota bacterium]
MIEFKNILLTTDLSSNSEAARPYAVALAKKYGATLHLLHVFEDAGYYHDAGMGENVPFAPLEWIENAQLERKKRLDALAASIEKEDGVKSDDVMRIGLAAREIIAHAQETKADCIVIATHGHTGLAHFIFGSVAEKVVRTSPCPVMTVRPKTKA